MHSLLPPEVKLEEDPPPDDLEKRIRIGCGALFGIIPGLWFAIGILCKMILERRGGQNDPAVVAALTQGEDAFRIAVRDRVLRDHPEVVKRCPECYRVLRTPRAQQCRWCFHDWHER